MKLTGLVASLAVTGTVSAAAVPRASAPVDGVVTRLNGVLGTLDGVLNGVLNGLLGGILPGDLAQVRTELTGIRGQLTQCDGSATKRDLLESITEPVKGLAEPVEGVAGQAVNTVEGATKRDLLEGIAEPVKGLTEPVEGVAGQAVNTVKGATTEVTSSVGTKRQTEGLQGLGQTLIVKVQNGDLDAAGLDHVLSLVQAGNLSRVTSLLGGLL